MYIKIYFNNKALFLCDTIDEAIQPYLHHEDTVFIDELNSHTVKTMIHEMQVEKVHAGVFYHSNLETLKNAFYKKFTVIQAAGGVVQNEKKEILLIFRRGKWDLPKGKLNAGETLENCAVREVEEETGLHAVTLLSPLTITRHTYHEGTKFILKESHWYKMRVTGKQSIIPQLEEDIQEARWVKTTGINDYLKNTYPSIEDVLNVYKQ